VQSMAQKVELADKQALDNVQGEHDSLKLLVGALPPESDFSDIRKEQAKLERQLAQFKGGVTAFQSLLTGESFF